MDIALVMFKSDGTRRDFPLTQPRTVIGRKRSCDLRIPLTSVSRQHCEVRIEDGVATIRDLGSSNGTYHNNSRVQEHKLSPGDEIVVGPVVFIVTVNGMPEDISPVRTIVDAARGEGESDQSAGVAAAEPQPIETEASDESVVSEEQTTPTVDLDDPIAALEALAGEESGQAAGAEHGQAADSSSQTIAPDFAEPDSAEPEPTEQAESAEEDQPADLSEPAEEDDADEISALDEAAPSEAAVSEDDQDEDDQAEDDGLEDIGVAAAAADEPLPLVDDEDSDEEVEASEPAPEPEPASEPVPEPVAEAAAEQAEAEESEQNAAAPLDIEPSQDAEEDPDVETAQGGEPGQDADDDQLVEIGQDVEDDQHVEVGEDVDDDQYVEIGQDEEDEGGEGEEDFDIELLAIEEEDEEKE